MKAQTRLAAEVTEEQDWYLDTPDVRLTKIFSVVLLLHAVAIAGILAFKMIDKASDRTAVTITTANRAIESAAEDQREVASEISDPTPASIAVEAPIDAPAQSPRLTGSDVAEPLRLDSNRTDQYRVVAGDTLTEIARDKGVSPDAIRSANNIISDNQLYPGRVLTIPNSNAPIGSEPVAPASASASASLDPADASVVDDAPALERPTPVSVDPTPAPEVAAPTHRVSSGETLWSISRRYNVSYQKLMQVNGITNPQALQVGQSLVVPSSQ
ncbi:MAG: LysM domain-containing protein [Verrucomicrobiota bacterium]